MLLKGSFPVSLAMCTSVFRNTFLSFKDFLRRTRLQDSRLSFSYMHIIQTQKINQNITAIEMK